MSTEKFFVIGINAEPWAVGSLGVGRKGKGHYPYMSPNQKLQAYQNALREELAGAEMLTGKVEVRLFVWRRIEKMKVYGGRDRKGKTSDATNIQKATEDAIQNLLIENDRNVRRISTEIVREDEDTEPCIVIAVRPYETQDLGLPDAIWAEIDKVTKAPVIENEGLLWHDPNSDPLADVRATARRAHNAWEIF